MWGRGENSMFCYYWIRLIYFAIEKDGFRKEGFYMLNVSCLASEVLIILVVTF